MSVFCHTCLTRLISLGDEVWICPTCSDKQSIRPAVTQKVIDVITEVADSQDAKGWEKYGITIDDADDSKYNWDRMAVEELVDGMKYMVKRNRELEAEVQWQQERLVMYAEKLKIVIAALKHYADKPCIQRDDVGQNIGYIARKYLREIEVLPDE